jgi:phage baseplate assembly protein W
MMNIDYPYHFDRQGRTALTDDDEHIRDLIEQFLFTSSGERVMRPEFGSGLLQMMFAPNSPEVAAALQFNVQAGLQRWLGDLVEIRDLEVESLESVLRVQLIYTVRRTNESRTRVFERSLV